MFSSKILHLKLTNNHLERIPVREFSSKLKTSKRNNESSAVLVWDFVSCTNEIEIPTTYRSSTEPKFQSKNDSTFKTYYSA